MSEKGKKRNPEDLIINGVRMLRDANGNVVTINRISEGLPTESAHDEGFLNKTVGDYVLEGIPCIFKNKVYAVMYSISEGRLMLHAENSNPNKPSQHIMLPEDEAVKLAKEILKKWGKE
ncbi:hypothetical protein ACK8P5_26415 (plasmid) [Paenibacillus sp. EC2-1]|uniref:hypothetical protein n=1 Tax=Paenibacillus sp. EC2-1 TaxID=3388665 RepID=UPI003BEEC73A